MVACSAGVFRVGESLSMFTIVVATIFDFMTDEDWGENRKGLFTIYKNFLGNLVGK